MLAPSDCARLVGVKTLRLLLLLLLMFMLPLRGTMGAAMACATSGNGDMHASHHGIDHDVAGGHHHAAGHGHAASVAEGKDHVASAVHGQDHGASDAHEDDRVAADHDCNLCAGFCSFTTVLPTQHVPPPAQAGPLAYPCIVAPAPSFHSDGQERPPRTI